LTLLLFFSFCLYDPISSFTPPIMKRKERSDDDAANVVGTSSTASTSHSSSSSGDNSNGAGGGGAEEQARKKPALGNDESQQQQQQQQQPPASSIAPLTGDAAGAGEASSGGEKVSLDLDFLLWRTSYVALLFFVFFSSLFASTVLVRGCESILTGSSTSFTLDMPGCLSRLRRRSLAAC